MTQENGEAAALADQFEQHRGRLFAIAYRLLGEVGRAEDMVQEAWLRLTTSATEPDELGAWLTTVVSRLCLDELRSARTKRETYVGPWLPEPVTAVADDPAQLAEQADDVSMALLLVLESLSPLERVVFVLREAFGYDHRELAAMLDKSPDAVRQVAHRARQHVSSRQPRFDPDDRHRQEVLERFAAAALSGDVRELAQTLAEDAVMLTDSGGHVSAARKPVLGREKVARFIVNLIPRYLTPEFSWSMGVVNGDPGLIVWQGADLDSVMIFEMDGDHVRGVHVQRNPEKLRHLVAVLPPPN